MELVNERWAEIKGWEGKYYISDHGRLKSIGVRNKYSMPEGYFTYGDTQKNGYRVATLRKPGLRVRIGAHALVAEYFCEKNENSECVNHKDGNKSNNHYSNLEWCTRAENNKHALDTGLLSIKGENHPKAKLTKENVIEMRSLRKRGHTYQMIADKFGISVNGTINAVIGKNWGWLKEGL